MKYLVKKIFKTETVTIDGEEITRETGELDYYKIKHKTNSRALPRGGKFLFIKGVDTKHPKIDTDEKGNLSIIEDVVAKTEADIKADFESRINIRLKRQDFGRRLIAIVSELNEPKGLTMAQIVQLSKTYADIRESCFNGAIDTAKALITAETPDGIIITESDKTALLDEINSNLEVLNYV